MGSHLQDKENVLTNDGFFFQAEDGIRDRDVAGVQTCVFRSSISAISGTL